VILPDRIAFVLDMNRLAGISREQWLDEDLWRQIRATLQGRRTFVADSAGLALVVAREPGQHVKRLPRVIRLSPDDLPDGPWTVTLGHDQRGPVTLDLAGAHRAILIGGATGAGKTNALQAILLQLAMKHAPGKVRLAVVDTKEVDFAGPWAGLPHLQAPIAHDVEGASELVERVEAERIRRQAMMAQAGASDWRELQDRPPLLILAVDEAADFEGTAAMETLIQVTRKGRAFGVSVLLGTQYPTSRVIDPQVKANLSTAIAFQCRTRTESRVILDRSGAEELDRPGLALTFVGGRWRRVQVLRADLDLIEVVTGLGEPKAPALSDVELALVHYAVEQLGGAFIVGKLYDALGDRISRRQINKLAKRWEQRGWLTEPQRDENGHPIGRQVTPELAGLAAPASAHTPVRAI
jgi:DNA segregation ATPase FtsK/SpoIIIE-like protein